MNVCEMFFSHSVEPGGRGWVLINVESTGAKKKLLSVLR